MPDISICIPVFNFPIEPLVVKLFKEITANSLNVEIVIIDDASDIPIRSLNNSLISKYSLNYVQLEENIGQSAIRNRFIFYTASPLLLFLDCDVMPQADNFISEYLAAAGKNKMVVCGGIRYTAEHVLQEKKLHWKYGRNREAIPATARAKKPYSSFLTGNFLVHKQILEQLPFNEALRGYGYEDTVYGIELERNKIVIKHTDITAEHVRMDDADAFISKTENALKNLFGLYQIREYKLLFGRYIKLIRVIHLLEKYKLISPAFFMYKKLAGTIRKRLVNGNTSLRLLDLYKLLFFVSLQKEKKPATPY